METNLNTQPDLTTRPAWRWGVRLGMLVVGIVLAVVYLRAVNDRWWPTPDSALYLGLGKNIAQGNGFVFNGVTDNTVTPGLPLIVAGARVLTGGEGIFALNLLMALCGLAAGWMIYKSLSLLENRLLAFATAVCTMVGLTFFELSHRILTDMPFIALAYAILYVALRYLRGGNWVWFAAAVLLTIVSLTIRAPGAVLLGPMVLGLILPLRMVGLLGRSQAPSGQPLQAAPPKASRRRAVILVGLLLAIVLGMTAMWYLWAKAISQSIPYLTSTMRYVNDLSPHRQDRIWQGVLKMWENLARVLVGDGKAQNHGMAFSAIILAGMVCMCVRRRFYVPFVALGYTAIILVIRRTDLPDRYLLPVMPLYILAALDLAWVLGSLVFRPLLRKYSAIAGLAAVMAVCWVIVGSSAAQLRREMPLYTRLPYTPEFYQKVEFGRFREMHAIAKVLREQTPLTLPAAVEKHPARMFHYFSDHLFVFLPPVGNLTAADADTLYDFYQRSPEVGIFVLRFEGPWVFQQRLRARFEPLVAKGVLRKVYHGERHVIYRRVETVAPASRP